MNRFLKILAVGCGLWAVGAKAQPPVPHRAFEAMLIKSARQVGNLLIYVKAPPIVRPPPPTFFRLTCSAPGDVQQSWDGLHWSEFGFCWSNLVVSNDFAPVVQFREVDEVGLSWTPSPSLGITNYRVVVFCDHKPLGFREYDVGLAFTNVFVPCLATDCSNYFEVCSMSCDHISQFSCRVGCVPGQRTLAIQ